MRPHQSWNCIEENLCISQKRIIVPQRTKYLCSSILWYNMRPFAAMHHVLFTVPRFWPALRLSKLWNQTEVTLNNYLRFLRNLNTVCMATNQFNMEEEKYNRSVLPVLHIQFGIRAVNSSVYGERALHGHYARLVSHTLYESPEFSFTILNVYQI